MNHSHTRRSKRSKESITMNERLCKCGSNLPSWREYDAQGIYLCRVCDACRDKQLARFRPEILTGYDQSDVDEPIEAEE